MWLLQLSVYFRTVIFLDGGLFLGHPAKGRDQLDFAPRLKKPVLLINGRTGPQLFTGAFPGAAVPHNRNRPGG